MNDIHAEGTQAVPPHAQLIQMGVASWVSATVYAAARLGIADHLASGPMSAAELAEPTGAHAPSLHRLMRTLAGLGLLTEGDGGRFALTPLGEALQSGAPGAARATVMTFGSPAFWNSWAEMVYSVETGKTGFEKANGMPVFEYLARHPEAASHFSGAMVGIHGSQPPAVAAAYDFSGMRSVVDVGGATGNMLAAILSRYPGPRGVLFDRPHVVRDAPALLAARGVADRVTIEPGDFFEHVPAGHDAYVLSHIIHDWNEEQCLTILGHCRRAMPPGSRLLIVETVLPPGDTPHQGKVLDMVMLVLPGGQERTEAEYASLLAKAGFRLQRVVPTASIASIVEAVPI
ncbi:MAG: methyltransferase [Vicinamibacterales bacterium]